jgi:hypothetical protein
MRYSSAEKQSIVVSEIDKKERVNMDDLESHESHDGCIL